MANVSKTLPTWASRSKFQYEGSVRAGTIIRYGTGFGFTDTISAAEYSRMLSKFSGKEVSIGTSRTSPPPGSLGEWFSIECSHTAKTSYIGPILLEEGYAERGSRSDRIRIKKA